MKKLFVVTIACLFFWSCKKTGTGGDTTPAPAPSPTPAAICNPGLQVPVTSSIVRGCFNASGVKDVHPRLLFSAADITRLKTAAPGDAYAKPMYDEIISRANAIIPTPVLPYALDGAGLRISNIHTFANDQLPYLVLAYQFTGQTQYAQRAWQQLDAMCNYPDWGANRHFLDAGIAAKAVAMAYDGLYNYLDAAQRTRLYNAVRAFVLQPGKTQIETNTGSFKWYLTDDNWNGICHGGMIMAALATYEMDSTFNSNLIALGANGILKYMQSLDPDGASEEGLSYWSYGLSNTFLAFEAMKRNLGSTYGLAEQPGFKKTGWFPYLISGPAGTSSFGDDYLYAGKTNKFLSYFWFSNYFNDASLAKAHYDATLSANSNQTNKMNGWTDLLFYKKDLVNAGSSAAMALNGYVRGVDYMYLAENNTSDNALYVGMHAGSNAASHGHLDAGSFYIQALGENFAMGNLGREDPYPADYFTTTQPSYTSAPTTTATARGRFYYYRVRTEAKNCLVFNPDARPEQNPAGTASISRQAADATGGYYVVSLTDCYSRDVSAYRRGIKLNRTTGLISVQDEFTPITGGTVYWLMHSPATDGLIISTDGKRATMTKNGKTYYAVISAPSNARFDKVDRSDTQINYLPETATAFSSIMGGKNSPNKWYGKLQIKLTGVAANAPTTIRVDFTKSATPSLPGLTQMDNWTTSN